MIAERKDKQINKLTVKVQCLFIMLSFVYLPVEFFVATLVCLACLHVYMSDALSISCISSVDQFTNLTNLVKISNNRYQIEF